MTNVMVLGAAGMAGHVMVEHLANIPGYKVVRCARCAMTLDTIPLDVTDFSRVEIVLREVCPDVVINCVGLLVQASHDRLDQAILINSYLPHFLSLRGRTQGFRLVHISTDCVFSGIRGGYTERDVPDGDTPYARTKALGEVVNNVDLTLRTSIIGPEIKPNGTGLLHWFLSQKESIKGYTRAYWSGVTTLELARVVDHCIRRNAVGLLHLAMKEKISKYDLLVECRRVWKRNHVQILPDDTHVSDKSLSSCRTDLPFVLSPNYGAMLTELKDFMDQHRNWSSYYK